MHSLKTHKDFNLHRIKFCSKPFDCLTIISPDSMHKTDNWGNILSSFWQAVCWTKCIHFLAILKNVLKQMEGHKGRNDVTRYYLQGVGTNGFLFLWSIHSPIPSGQRMTHILRELTANRNQQNEYLLKIKRS